MLLTGEVLLLLYLIWRGITYLTMPFSTLTERIFLLCFSLIGSTAVFVLMDTITSFFSGSVMWKLLFSIMAAVVAWWVTPFLLKNKVEQGVVNLREACQQWRFLKSLRYLFFVGWLLLLFVIGHLLINLLVMLPEFPPKKFAGTLYIYLLIDEEEKPSAKKEVVPKVVIDGKVQIRPEEATPNTDTLRAYQERLYSGLRSGLKDSKEYLAEVSGTKAVLERMALVKELTAMDVNKKKWLSEHNPHLRALIHNKLLNEIMADHVLMQRIQKASKGSVEDVVALMSEPKLEKLLQDEEIIRAVRSLDLYELKEEMKQYPGNK